MTQEELIQLGWDARGIFDQNQQLGILGSHGLHDQHMLIMNDVHPPPVQQQESAPTMQSQILPSLMVQPLPQMHHQQNVPHMQQPLQFPIEQPLWQMQPDDQLIPPPQDLDQDRHALVQVLLQSNAEQPERLFATKNCRDEVHIKSRAIFAALLRLNQSAMVHTLLPAKAAETAVQYEMKCFLNEAFPLSRAGIESRKCD